jgi:hypothetical protein
MRTLDEQAATSDRPSTDAEALIREARRLRRRRWAIGIAVVVLALIAGGIGIGIGGGGSRGAVGSSGSGSGAAAGSGSRQDRSGVAIAAHAPLAVESGLVAPDEGWVSNGNGLYLTTNGARTWRTITPKNLVGNDAVGRMDELVAMGSAHFWLPVSGVGLPGGRCYEDSCRGSAIDSTTNAGRSWRVSWLPDCAWIIDTISSRPTRRA